MEVYMELTKKTTILLTPRLHNMLTGLSKAQHTSIGELVRRACEKQYGITSEDASRDAANRLSEFELPVGTSRAMKHESVPTPNDFLP
jgi:hypothetical protein